MRLPSLTNDGSKSKRRRPLLGRIRNATTSTTATATGTFTRRTTKSRTTRFRERLQKHPPHAHPEPKQDHVPVYRAPLLATTTTALSSLVDRSVTSVRNLLGNHPSDNHNHNHNQGGGDVTRMPSSSSLSLSLPSSVTSTSQSKLTKGSRQSHTSRASARFEEARRSHRFLTTLFPTPDLLWTPSMSISNSLLTSNSSLTGVSLSETNDNGILWEAMVHKATLAELLDLLSWIELFRSDSVREQHSHVWKTAMRAWLVPHAKHGHDYKHRHKHKHKPTHNHNSNIHNKDNHKEKEDDFDRQAVATLQALYDAIEREVLGRTCAQAKAMVRPIYERRDKAVAGSSFSLYLRGGGFTHRRRRYLSSLTGDTTLAVGTQLRLIRQRSHASSRLPREAAAVVSTVLREIQNDHRDRLVDSTWEDAALAANDFYWLSERCAPTSMTSTQSVMGVGANNDLACLADETAPVTFMTDAVYAARSLHRFAFQELMMEGPCLWSAEDGWSGNYYDQEEQWQRPHPYPWQNRIVIRSLLETLEDYRADMAERLQEALIPKAMEAFLKATVSYCVWTLIARASLRQVKHRQQQKKPQRTTTTTTRLHSQCWSTEAVAVVHDVHDMEDVDDLGGSRRYPSPYWKDREVFLHNMNADLEALSDYFRTHCGRGHSGHLQPSCTVDNEFKVLRILHELLGVAMATGVALPHTSKKTLRRSFTPTITDVKESNHLIVFLCQRLRGDVDLTKRLVADLWSLAAPRHEKLIWAHMNDTQQGPWMSSLTKPDKHKHHPTPPTNPKPPSTEPDEELPGTLLDLATAVKEAVHAFPRDLPSSRRTTGTRLAKTKGALRSISSSTTSTRPTLPRTTRPTSPPLPSPTTSTSKSTSTPMPTSTPTVPLDKTPLSLVSCETSSSATTDLVRNIAYPQILI